MSVLGYLRKNCLQYLVATGLALITIPEYRNLLISKLPLERLPLDDPQISKESVEYSNILHKDAVVVRRIYMPATSNLNTKPLATRVGETLGTDTNGNIGLNVKGVLVSYNKVPETYDLVFKSKIDSFTIQGLALKNKDLFDSLHEGQKVDIAYKEIYRATYKDIDGDGKEDLVRRVLVGVEFLDVKPK